MRNSLMMLVLLASPLPAGDVPRGKLETVEPEYQLVRIRYDYSVTFPEGAGGQIGLMKPDGAGWKSADKFFPMRTAVLVDANQKMFTLKVKSKDAELIRKAHRDGWVMGFAR